MELGGAPDVTTGGSSGTTPSGGSAGAGAPPLVRVPMPSDKLDVLLMVDNSIGMGDKQLLLSRGIGALLGRFTNPRCVDASGNPTGANADTSGACTDGTPEIPPIRDIHLGVITSSLGDHGSNDVCSDQQNTDNQANGSPASTYDDRAELIPAVRTGVTDPDGTGFLSWGPDSTDTGALTTGLADQITAAGEHGCGYEGQLESWYRFLIDPEPVSTLTNNNSVSERGAVNQVVLAERAAFLRPDSAVLIMMLSDENDCSILDENGSQGWLVGYKGGVGNLSFHMPYATSVCATNPNDPCCMACSGAAVAGCVNTAEDPACNPPYRSVQDDSMNLRCFAQKQRFGVDLLYPTARYSSALTSRLIEPRLDGMLVQNPLFAAPDGVVPRDPSRVYLAGIVGVPWEDVATADTLAHGIPTSVAGVAFRGTPVTYMTADELAANGRWDVMLGDPEHQIAPTDPLMLEQIDPRPTGTPHPLVDAPIAAPDETILVNPINGHEQAVATARDDLQFACIYPLAQPLSADACDADSDSCDCNADEFDKNSPLCSGTTMRSSGSQLYGKGYPALRELEVLKHVGSNAILSSICAENVMSDDPGHDPSYGYNPAFAAMGDRVQTSFAAACESSKLPIVSDGGTSIKVFETRPSISDCRCDAPGRSDIDASDPVLAANLASFVSASGIDPTTACTCEITQLSGADLTACRSTAALPASLHGFCYVEPGAGLGDAALVLGCPSNAAQRLRFVGDGVPAPNALIWRTTSTDL
jgi:hypothetical protein